MARSDAASEEDQPDAEIDKLLEALCVAGQLTIGNGASYINGKLLDNDIRLSSIIRDAIEEVKYVQKLQGSRSNELEKARFL